MVETKRPDIRARFRAQAFREYTVRSDRTKWERIGHTLFVKQPLLLIGLFNPYSDVTERILSAKELYKLYTE